MATPALLRLREAEPDAVIALLTPDKLVDLWTGFPAIDDVLTFSGRDGLWTTARRVRAWSADIAVVLPNSFRSAAEVWCARVPRRIGYTGQNRRWMLTEKVPPRTGAVRMRKRSAREVRRLTNWPGGHEAGAPNLHGAERTPEAPGPLVEAHHLHQYLHLVQRLGANPAPRAPSLFVTHEETLQFRKRFEIAEPSGRPLFGLNAGAEYGPAKRWPLERFASVARAVQARTRCRWVLFGAARDMELTRRLANDISGNAAECRTSIVNVAGLTSLRELCAGLKACQVLLTNDTGPMHVAAAVGTPVVALFGSTSPMLTGPGLGNDARHWILREPVACAPCFLRNCPIDFRCMRSISETQVVDALLSATVP